MTAERLQKVLAAAGVASRRHSEALITAGRVRVDGRVVTELGSRVEPTVQRIEVDGQPLPAPAGHNFIMLNKPMGYVSTASDPQGRETVFDLLPRETRLFSVGRLDRDTEGLLLFTDDGDLAYRVTHPRFGLEKEYRIWTVSPTREEMDALASGVRLSDGLTAPARVETWQEGRDTLVGLTIHEGRNRQVRRMFEALGLPIYRLVRTRVGPLRLGDLRSGEWRILGAGEVALLRRVLARTASK